MKDYSGTEIKLHDTVFFAWGDPSVDKPGADCLYRGKVTDLLESADLVEVTADEQVGTLDPRERFLAKPYELQVLP